MDMQCSLQRLVPSRRLAGNHGKSTILFRPSRTTSSLCFAPESLSRTHPKPSRASRGCRRQRSPSKSCPDATVLGQGMHYHVASRISSKDVRGMSRTTPDICYDKTTKEKNGKAGDRRATRDRRLDAAKLGRRGEWPT